MIIYLIVDESNEILMSSLNIEILLKLMIEHPKELGGQDIIKLTVGIGTERMKVRMGKCNIIEIISGKVVMEGLKVGTAMIWARTACRIENNYSNLIRKRWIIRCGGIYNIIPLNYEIDEHG